MFVYLLSFFRCFSLFASKETCAEIYPYECCSHCHKEKQLLLPVMLKSGKILYCCCAATQWLDYNNLLLDEYSFPFQNSSEKH